MVEKATGGRVGYLHIAVPQLSLIGGRRDGENSTPGINSRARADRYFHGLASQADQGGPRSSPGGERPSLDREQVFAFSNANPGGIQRRPQLMPPWRAINL